MPSLPHPVTRRGLAAGAAVTGALLSVRALARPLPTTDRRLLDWEAVRTTALARCGETDTTDLDLRAPALGRRYDAMAAEVAPLMAAVCGTPVEGFPPFTVVGRRGFIERNLVIIQRLFEPVERLRAQIPESRATVLSRTVLSRYIGELFGFLSRRVLGQYDPVLLLAPAAEGDPASALYLVEPNVEAFERGQHLPADDLRRWLILHELTHAWQFEAHPWLREHLASLMRELLASELTGRIEAQVSGGGGRLPSTGTLLRALPGSVRGQLRAVSRIQAVMSVCEGYSNYVMHEVGALHLRAVADLERAFHARSAQRPLLERIVFAITGLNMKLRQYELGERFARAVVADGGLALLNRVWDGPEMMPTMAELEAPGQWTERIRSL